MIKRSAYLGFSLVVFVVTLLICMLSEEIPSMGVIEAISNEIIRIIAHSGYLGIVVLMLLESACMPVPSEIIMPFSGFLVSLGVFDFWLVVTAGTVGNLLGSILAYVIGIRAGRRFIEKYGRYLLIEKEALKIAEKWFKKHGNVSILVSRVLPVIRTVISLPAGIGRMEFNSFAILTFVGSIPWNFLLTYLGIELGRNWTLIEWLMRRLDLAFLVGLLLLLGYFVFFYGGKVGR